jgi:hypothetical protein
LLDEPVREEAVPARGLELLFELGLQLQQAPLLSMVVRPMAVLVRPLRVRVRGAPNL